MEELIPQVITWAEERNIVRGSSLEKETLQLISKCGNLTDFIDNRDICENGIGHCAIEIIIICRMRHVTLDECINSTKTISDERILDPKLVSIMVLKYLGNLSRNILMKKEIKTELGYLFVFITALAKDLNLSVSECIINAFEEIKDYKGIMFEGQFLDEKDEKYELAKSIIKSNELASASDKAISPQQGIYVPNKRKSNKSPD